MSKSKNQFRILEKDGTYGYISASRARHCLSMRLAVTVRKGVIQFVPEPDAPKVCPRPLWGASLDVIPQSDTDSGQSGFLRYPPPAFSSPRFGMRFPTLAKLGAGL